MKDTDTLRDILDCSRSAIVDVLWDDDTKTGMEVCACNGDDGMVLLGDGGYSEPVPETMTVREVRALAQQCWGAQDYNENSVIEDAMVKIRNIIDRTISLLDDHGHDDRALYVVERVHQLSIDMMDDLSEDA